MPTSASLGCSHQGSGCLQPGQFSLNTGQQPVFSVARGMSVSSREGTWKEYHSPYTVRLPALGPCFHMATVTELTPLSTAAPSPYDQETLEVGVPLFLSNISTFLWGGDLGKCGWLFPWATSESQEVKWGCPTTSVSLESHSPVFTLWLTSHEDMRNSWVLEKEETELICSQIS